MEELATFRCLRCGHEFSAVHSKDGELVERTCPRCRSNSIRPIKGERRTEAQAR